MVMTLLDMNVEDRDPSLSEAACMMALATIVTERHVAPATSIVTTSTSLRALLNDVETPLASGLPHFTEAEQGLLVEWLDRLRQSTP